MKNRSILPIVGILIYLVLSITNRFIYQIPDFIYIPIALIGLGLILVSIIIDYKKEKTNENK